MYEKTESERAVEELEAAILEALDLYFEARRREVQESKGRAGPAFEAYDEARRQLAEAEEELEEIRRRTDELKAGTVDAVVGDNETTELRKDISELQRDITELREEVRVLAEAEKASRKRKDEAEEKLRRAELAFKGDLGLSADRIAASALRKVEEIDAFKAQLDQNFKKGRTSVLGAAN